MTKNQKFLLIPVTIALVFAGDYLTKSWISTFMEGKQVVELTSFFNLVLAYNRGVSFSMFQAGSAYGVWMLVALTSLLTLFVLYLALISKDKFEMLAFSMIAGGALGNLFDRVRLGVVIDFLDFHAYGYHWPAFNVADSAICIGVGLLFIHQFLLNFKKKQEG